MEEGGREKRVGGQRGIDETEWTAPRTVPYEILWVEEGKGVRGMAGREGREGKEETERREGTWW